MQKSNLFKRIFIGSATADLKQAKIIAEILSSLNTAAILWSDIGTFVSGKSTIDNLIDICKQVDGAIFIFGNSVEDDFKSKDAKKVFIPRDNVLIEFGLFAAYLHYSRTHIVRFEGTKIASDLAGITYTDYRSKRKLTIKIKDWLEKHINNTELRTPYQEYLFALQESAKLKGKLKMFDEGLLELAHKYGVNYKKVTETEKELWKIVFMYEHFSELIIRTIHHYPDKDKLIEKLNDCDLGNHSEYLKYKHLPFERVLENCFMSIVRSIIKEEIPGYKFAILIKNIHHEVFQTAYTNVFNIDYYWTIASTSSNMKHYNNLGG